jgi:replicative DNA helicase
LRNPPHDLDAEMAVLGGILLDPGSFETAAGLISAPDFYPEKHRIIFTGVQRLLAAGSPVDLISLSGLLKSDGNLDKAGGAAYLAELVDFIPTSASVGYYCGVIQKKALARRTIEAARHIAEAAYADEDPDVIISSAYASLEELSRQVRGEDAALLTLVSRATVIFHPRGQSYFPLHPFLGESC